VADGDARASSRTVAAGHHNLTMVERHRSIVDVHLVINRDEKILMLRRANTSYADGQLCLPSGHLEPGESVVQAAVRETREEVGIVLDLADVRFAHVAHRHDPDGRDRVGFFFAAQHWRGEPVNAEPHKCTELVWVDPDDLPEDVVRYQAAVLELFGLEGPALRSPVREGPDTPVFSLHGWPDPRETPREGVLER